MTNPPARTAEQRRQDTLHRLTQDVDAWVATADPATGAPYLVPLSFLWDGTALLIATPAASATGRNLRATGKVRLGIGLTRDVVLVEGTVQESVPAAEMVTSPSVGHIGRQFGQVTSVRLGHADVSLWPPCLVTSAESRRTNDMTACSEHRRLRFGQPNRP